MAILSDTDRRRIWRGLQRFWSGAWEPTAFGKAELLAAANATDDWIEANQASYNTALPGAFRTGATQEQKTLLFMAVALARMDISLLRRVLGEVD